MQSVRELAFLGLRATGMPWLLRHLFQRNTVTILFYHDLDPRCADRHFQALRKRYNVISLAACLDALEMGTFRQLPPRSVVLTFDDGYRRNLDLVPILDRHQIPATVFLCSGIVGTSRRFWFAHVRDRARKDQLKALQNEDRLAALAKMGYLETMEFEERQSLSDDEVQAMKGVVDFQSHTVFHPCLPRCTSAHAQVEIVNSKRQLEERYGLAIYALAYPNGDHSERDVRWTKEAGYRCGLTTVPGYVDENTDVFRLPRLWINDTAGFNELVVEASGLFGQLYRVLKRVR